MGTKLTSAGGQTGQEKHTYMGETVAVTPFTPNSYFKQRSGVHVLNAFVDGSKLRNRIRSVANSLFTPTNSEMHSLLSWKSTLEVS